MSINLNSSNELNPTKLNEILNKTVESLKSTKNEINNIVDSSKDEYKKVEKELEEIKEKVKKVIDEVLDFEKQDRDMRNMLSLKNKNFNKYSESEMRKAYDEANKARINLIIKTEEEKTLRAFRNSLEIRLKNAQELVEKAEGISSQLSVATEYLTGDLDKMTKTMDELSEKHYLGFRIIEAQEEEKRRLAREVHDGPAQSLANVILKFELCEQLVDRDVERAKKEIVDLKHITKGSLKELRKTIYDLRPMSLDDLGLIPTIERYVNIFSDETGIMVDFKHEGNYTDLEGPFQIGLFRIIQEALTNIKKHSKANNASIIMEKERDYLNLSIIDDGIGFEMNNDIKNNDIRQGGFGLVSLRERADLLGGKLNISSGINEGTRIILIISMNEEDNNAL